MQLAHDWFPQPIPPGVSIGEGTWLHSAFAFIHCRSTRPSPVRIGKRCGVYKGSLFELGPDGEIEIGEHCTLVGVIVAVNGLVRIGNYCFLAHEVFIADSSMARPWPAGDHDRATTTLEPEESVVLGDDVWVGAGAVLLKGARLGDGAIIGAGTVVDFAVPSGAIVAGDPARIVAWTDGR